MMNLKGLFQEFNPSKFLVYSSLFLCSLLVGLKLDNLLPWSYWIVFTPLWIWKIIVLAGASVGTIMWVRHPEYRREDNVDLQAMLIATCFHVLLLLFELLLCANLEGQSDIPYRITFVPLFCMSAFSIGACVWGFRHDRSLEFLYQENDQSRWWKLETFFSVNVLQFICVALKLDHVIGWNWVVVMVPIWIILTLLCVIVLYYVIWAVLFVRSPDITPAQRRGHIIYATMSCFMVVPLLSFLVTLSRKLDRIHDEMYVAVFIPLQVSFISLMVTAFYQKGGNPWWFGVRKDFCEFLLDMFPCLREYGNVSYKFSDTIAPGTDEAEPRPRDSESKRVKRDGQTWTLAPAQAIEMPD